MAKKDMEQTEQPEGKKSKLPLILAIVGGLILLGGVGVGAYFLGASGKEQAPEDAVIASSTPAKKAPAGKIGPMVDVSGFIINILDRDEIRYLKAAITLEADSEAGALELQERQAQVRDAILLLVGNKTFDELRDLQGKMQLRSELIAQINTMLQQGQVKNIYFTDFVVQ